MTGYFRLRRALAERGHRPRIPVLRARRAPQHLDGRRRQRQPEPPAPPGTPTWPGYPFTGMINGHCLGSSYKGYLYATGRMDFKKEISHTAGYTGARDGKQLASPVPVNAWIGFKVIIRNFNDDQAVHMESWVDERADGNWRKVNELRDTGGWNGGSSALDGCTGAPFNYRPDQLITWAGPYVNFRFDFLSSRLEVAERAGDRSAALTLEIAADDRGTHSAEPRRQPCDLSWVSRCCRHFSVAARSRRATKVRHPSRDLTGTLRRRIARQSSDIPPRSTGRWRSTRRLWAWTGARHQFQTVAGEQRPSTARPATSPRSSSAPTSPACAETGNHSSACAAAPTANGRASRIWVARLRDRWAAHRRNSADPVGRHLAPHTAATG